MAVEVRQIITMHNRRIRRTHHLYRADVMNGEIQWWYLKVTVVSHDSKVTVAYYLQEVNIISAYLEDLFSVCVCVGDFGWTPCSGGEVRLRILQKVPQSEYRAVSENLRQGKSHFFSFFLSWVCASP